MIVTTHWLDVTRICEITIQVCKEKDQKKNEREQVDGKNWKHCFSLVSEEGYHPSEKIDDGYAKQNNQQQIDVNIPTHHEDGKYCHGENDEKESTGSQSQTNNRLLHSSK